MSTYTATVVWTRSAGAAFKDNKYAELDELHHRAHESCCIANSVKTDVVIEPR